MKLNNFSKHTIMILSIFMLSTVTQANNANQMGPLKTIFHQISNKAPQNVVGKNTQQILIWSKKTALNIFSLSPSNYKHKLQYLSNFFTKQSFNKFQQALQESGLMHIISEENYKATPHLNGPVVTAPLKINGQKAYLAIVPVIVEYQNRKYIQRQKLKIELQIVPNHKKNATPFLVSHFNAVLTKQSKLIKKYPSCKIKAKKL